MAIICPRNKNYIEKYPNGYFERGVQTFYYLKGASYEISRYFPWHIHTRPLRI